MTDISTAQNPEEAFRIALSRFLLTVRTFTPGIIDSEPKKVGRFWCVDVVPTIRRVVKNGSGEVTTKTQEKIAGVPLGVSGSTGAGLTITVPVKIGDICLLAVCDRGIDNWQLADGPQDPPELEELRHHDLTDAICFPLGSTLETIEEYDNDAIQIRDAASETVISLKSGEVRVTGPAVIVDSPSTTLGLGGAPIARVGDQVQVNPGTHIGTILTGGANTSI